MENKAQLAGIFTIASGVMGALISCSIFAIAVLVLYIITNPFPFEINAATGGLTIIIAAFYFSCGFAYLVISTLAITGGVYAINKKYWGFALAGAIGASILFWPLGIAAIIFVTMGKNEFISLQSPRE